MDEISSLHPFSFVVAYGDDTKNSPNLISTNHDKILDERPRDSISSQPVFFQDYYVNIRAHKEM